MKRSLFIAIVVLLMAALFVSCNADKALEDQLFEVTIDGGSRAVEASATLDIDIEQLFWFYKAEKIGGIFTQGQQLTEVAVKKDTDNAPVKGLAKASLGTMSQGIWRFSFYGYNSVSSTGAPVGDPVYKQDSLEVRVNAKISLAVTLERGTGALPKPQIGFVDGGITWMAEGVATNLTLTLEITDNDEDFLADIQGVYETEKSRYVFVVSGTEEIEVGEHIFKATVVNSYTYNNEIISEIVGQTTIKIDAQAGMKYIIGDVSNTASGIDVVDVPVEVEIGTPTKPLEATAVVAASTAAQTITTNVSPAGAAAGATQVTFPANSFDAGDADMKLDVVTYSAESAAAKFTVTDNSAVVAGIDLTLSAGNQTVTTFKNNEVTVVTYIAKNLTDVAVHFNGTGTAPTLVGYDATSGRLEFKTTHFSEYYVTSKAVALIGDEAYGTLAAAVKAVQDGQTIKLLVDADITSPLNFTKNDVVLDLNGKTIFNTNDIWCVNSDGDWSLISVSGSLTIKGDGKLLAKENDCYAIDIWNGGACVIEDGEIVGNVHAVYVYEGSLEVKGGVFSVLQVYSATQPYQFVLNNLDASYRDGIATISVTGGTFYKFNPENCEAEGLNTIFTADGYCAVADGDYWTVVPAVSSIGTKGYSSIASAVAAAQSGDTINLLTDASDIGSVNLPAGVVLEGNGKTIEGNSCIWMGNGATIQNVNFKDIDDGKTKTSYCKKGGTLTAIYGSGSATITGCSFDNCSWEAIQLTPVANSVLTVTGNTFRLSGGADIGALRYIHVQSAQNTDFTVTATGNKFYDGDCLDQTGLEVYYPVDAEKVNLSRNYMDKPMAVCIGTGGTSYNNATAEAFPFVEEDMTTEVAVYATAIVPGVGVRVFLTAAEAEASGLEYTVL